MTYKNGQAPAELVEQIGVWAYRGQDGIAYEMDRPRPQGIGESWLLDQAEVEAPRLYLVPEIGETALEGADQTNTEDFARPA